MTSQPSWDALENPHTMTYEGMNIHDVLSERLNIEILEKLLDQGERPCDQCFILAARTRYFASVQKLLEFKPAGINTEDHDGKSLLSYFAMQPENLLQLLKMGANPAVSDIGSVLELVILNSRYNNRVSVIEILNRVTCSGVQIEVIRLAHIFKDLVHKPLILKHILDLGANPNIPGINFVIKTIIIQYKVSSKTNCTILTHILNKISKSGVSLVDDEGVTLLKYCLDDSRHYESLKILIKLGSPLQEPFIQCALETLVSNLNLRESDTDLYDVFKLIVDNGHKLVDSKGDSLIKHCRNEKILLYLLRLGADPNVPEIHNLLRNSARQSCLEEFKEILTRVVSAGVQLENENTSSSIFCYTSNKDIVYHLLQLGVSPFSRSGDNLIEYTFKLCGSKDYVQDLELFIKLGFNVMKEDKFGCTFLCSAIEICLDHTTYMLDNIDASCELVRYMLDHPEIRDEHFKVNCASNHHPQDILARYHRLHDSRLVDMILTSKFKDIHRVTISEFTGMNHKYHGADFSFISLFLLNKCLSVDSMSVKDIDFLYEHGFSINDPGVSPLTVALMSYSSDNTDLIKCLLQRGVNVEQSILALKNKDLQEFKLNLKIPDALIIAANAGKSLEVFQLLAPHAAFPPLALLLFILLSARMDIMVDWYQELVSLGRVPHGTHAYRAIRQKVRDMAYIQDNQDLLLPAELSIPLQVGGIKSQELTIFDLAHRSPLSLLELSRYAVRMSLADTAAASNTQSLPQLFKSLLPPGLTDLLIAHKIEQVRNCEDKWLNNEEELLKNPLSLIFVNVYQDRMTGENKRP